MTSIPTHIAIIPDGNRRWAKENGLPTLIGHKKGFDRTTDLIFYSEKLGVKAITFYAFSTENWDRAEDEVSYLMDLFVQYFDKYLKKFHELGIKFRHLGNFDNLSDEAVSKLKKAMELTKDNSGMVLQLALNYGGRDEIKRAVQKIVEKGTEASKITEALISDNLDTTGVPDPDLVIRTSGEERTSGFLPWQAVYSELYFCPKYWPDFTKEELDKAITEFSDRQRRFGK